MFFSRLAVTNSVCIDAGRTTTACSLQSRDQGEGWEFIFGLYIVNNFPYGKLKIKDGERKNEKDVNCYDDGGDGYGIYGV